ncbi:unnamed protein product, partial [Didymodactylos carnosus]
LFYQYIISTLITSVIILLCYFTIVEYRRVQRRDKSRLRHQKYSLSDQNDIDSIRKQLDPLDHTLYWYPVALSHEITNKQPYGFQLLNEPLCLYRTGKNNDVVCVVDRCPHRSAPLSLGQMTKQGTLECIYHGWQYGVDGKCQVIPSTSKYSNVASVICAQTKPVHEQYGFIWVWPGRKDLAHSDLIPHQLLADLQHSTDYIMSPEGYRVLDIPYDLMVDNLLDIAHIDFTHDGLIGKRSLATCIKCEKLSTNLFSSINSESCSFKLTRPESTKNKGECTYMHFLPPCFIRLEHIFQKERKFTQIMINIPSATNKMKLLFQFYRNFAKFKFVEYIPGYDYYMNNMNVKIVNQDLLLLDGINRNVDLYSAPLLGSIVSADQPIKAFRKYQMKTLMKYQTIYFKSWQKQIFKDGEGSGNSIDDIEDLRTS